jgi:hypothetical protein
MPNLKLTDDEIALYEAINAVFIYGVKSLLDYPEDQRQKIVDAYRFSATRYNSNQSVHVPFTPDTLDII